MARSTNCSERGSARRSRPLGLVAHQGREQSVSEIEAECRRALCAVAEEYIDALQGSKSLWLSFLAVIAAECSEGVEMVALAPVG